MLNAFLARPDSDLGERVAKRAGGKCVVLDGRDPRVVVDGGAVRWNGVELSSATALVIEAPWISWPQPIAEGRAGELATDMQRRGIAQRERRALHVAALRILRPHVRIANDPERAAELALCAALSLERLSAAGIPTCEWRVISHASEQADVARLALTAEFGPMACTGGAQLEIDLGGQATTRQLCIGGEWIASTRCESLHSPLPKSVEATRATEAERELARSALAQLGLVFGCVHLAGGAIAFVDAAVDLQAWDLASDGLVAGALANWLTHSPSSDA